MKTLKALLIVAVLAISFTSCTKESLTEDEQLLDTEILSRTGVDEEPEETGE